MPLNLETKMLIAILELTRDGPVPHEIINRHARIPTDIGRKLLRTLQNDGLIYVRRNIVEADDTQRLGLATRALRSGADLERVSRVLQWREFEGIAAVAFAHNDYGVIRNLRFRHGGRRWEIDVVGCRRPLVVCVDCKHWKRGLHRSNLERIVKEQVERVHALANSLPNPKVKIECTSWSVARFVPVVLSLVVDKFKFYSGVPVVPILQLQDFLSQLPAYADDLLFLVSEGPRTPFFSKTNLADKSLSSF
jgi:Holliday junction resolvase-like predicted endonuclease